MSDELEQEGPESENGSETPARKQRKHNAGRKPLSRQMYDLIIEGYRRTPGNASACARYAGVDRATASRGWSRGWQSYPWAVPARQVLEQEAIAATARAGELAREAEAKAQAEREKAAREVVEAKAMELQLLKAARYDALSLVGAIARLKPAIEALADHVVRESQPSPETGRLTISADSALKRLNLVALALQRASAVMGEVITQGRLERGQTTANVGIQAQEPQPLTYDQAVEELDSIDELRAALATRGHLLQAAITVLPEEAH